MGGVLHALALQTGVPEARASGFAMWFGEMFADAPGTTLRGHELIWILSKLWVHFFHNTPSQCKTHRSSPT